MRRIPFFLLALLANGTAVAEPANWSGFYVGAFMGYGRSVREMSVEPTYQPTGHPDRSAWLAGGLAGLSFQSGPFVYGVELDAAVSAIEPRMTYLATAGNDAIHVYTTHAFLATARAHAGFSFGPLLLYGTGGVAWKHDRSKLALTSGPAPNWGPVVAFEKLDQDQLGYAVGGGLALAATEAIAFRLEYLRYEFGKQDFQFPTAETSGAASIDVARAAIVLTWR